MAKCCLGYGSLCIIDWDCNFAPDDAPKPLPFSKDNPTRRLLFDIEIYNHLLFYKSLYESHKIGGENDGEQLPSQ